MLFNNQCGYVTFLCAVFCFAWSTQDKISIRVPLPLVLQMRQQAEACEKTTGTPASQLKKILDYTLPEDEFFLCVSTNAGFIDKDSLTKLMWDLEIIDGNKEEYYNTLTECNKIVKETVLKTVIAKANCIHENYKYVPAKQ